VFTQGHPTDYDPEFRSDDSLPSLPSPQYESYHGALHYRTPSNTLQGTFRGDHKHAIPLSARSFEVHEDERDIENEDYIVHQHGPLQEIELGQTNEEGEQIYLDDDRFDNHISRTVESYI